MEHTLLSLGERLVALRNDPLLNGIIFLSSMGLVALLVLIALLAWLAFILTRKKVGFFKRYCPRCLGRLALAVNVPSSSLQPHLVPVRCQSCRDLTWRENGEDLEKLRWE